MERCNTTRNTARSVTFLTRTGAGRRNADVAGRRATLIYALLLAPLLWAGPVAAPAAPADLQSLADIRDVAVRFAAGRAAGRDVTASPLDSRLRLKRCDRPLEAFSRGSADLGPRAVIGVRCTGSQPWKVYVPVRFSDLQTVVVLANALPRGHVLKAADLRVEKREVGRLAGGYAVDPAKVVGQKLALSLAPGSIITPQRLAARLLVRRGQAVTLEVENAAIRIRVAGKALMDGRLNQRIRVENLSSGRIVEGLVRSAQTVEVLAK